MQDVIKSCLITNSDAKVLRQYCIDKSNPLYQQYKGFCTSVNLEATNVFTMYSGRIAMISGDERSTYQVVVQINSNQCIRYTNLKSVNVKYNQQVDVSQQIGVARRYVGVEYLTTYVKNPFSFRLGSIQLYKDDPAKILDSTISSIQNNSLQYSESGLMDFNNEYNGGIDSSSEFILSNNRGED